VARRKAEEFIETFGALSRCLRSVAWRAYASFEVGGTQAKFLRYIGRQTGISQADLARATDTDPALTGRVLETLIERGWLRRKRSVEDRRQYVLELSPAGQRVHKRVEEARSGIAERVMAELDEKDVKDFERIAKKLLAALDATGAGDSNAK
jgi:DNA-binding MarR family transcriptional regulator